MCCSIKYLMKESKHIVSVFNEVFLSNLYQIQKG